MGCLAESLILTLQKGDIFQQSVSFTVACNFSVVRTVLAACFVDPGRLAKSGQHLNV